MTQQFPSGYLFEKNENTNLQRYMYPNVHSSIIYNAKMWRQPKVKVKSLGHVRLFATYGLM